MNTESTPQGDSIVVTNVESAAEALMNRSSQAEAKESDEPSTPEAEPIEDIKQAEPEIESEVDSESETTDAIEDEAEASFSTIAELAEATGIDIDEFKKQINVTTKVQGEEKQVNLADLIKGYQLESDYTRKNEAFLNEQKNWENQRTEAQTKLTAEFERTGQAFRMAQQQLTHEFNATNWSELETSNPSEYLIQRQKFGERQAQIDQAINQATHQAQQVMANQQKESNDKQQQYLTQQDDLLLKAIPEWSEAKVRKAQSAEVAEFLAGNGYSSEEIGHIRDHRIILMARNAMKGVKSVKDVDLAKKKVNKVPKLVKPNARQQVNQKTQAIEKKRANLKRTGSVEDLAKLLLARG